MIIQIPKKEKLFAVTFFLPNIFGDKIHFEYDKFFENLELIVVIRGGFTGG